MSTFVAGNLYTNAGAGPYGTDQGTVATAVQSSNEPARTWLCVATTASFSTWASRSGLGTYRKLRNYYDILGTYVFPYGRFSGAPIFRA
jgi:hypothetical protein